jgi:hypothetical protein
MKHILLIAIFFGFVFSACKKSKEEPVCELSKDTLVGTYKLTDARYKATANGTESSVINNTTYIKACEKDDNLVLTANGVYTVNDIGIACVPNGTDTGVWSLTGTTFVLDGLATTVQNFSCAGFELVLSNYITNGDRYTIVYTR